MRRRCLAALLFLLPGGILGSGLSHAAWQKVLGGESADEAYSVRQTADNGYIIAGYTVSYGAGSEDFYLIKTDSKGNKIWQRTFGTPGDEWASSVHQTTDGGYIIAGSSGDVRLIKTDANGRKTWQKTFGGLGLEEAKSVQQTKDGGYIIAGYTSTYGAGDMDVYLIKTDANGNKIWQRTFGGVDGDSANSVQQTTDGGYIIVGRTTSYGRGSADVYLIKTDSKGRKIWQRTFGGEYFDEGCSVQQTSDKGYIVAGRTQAYSTAASDVYLIKTDSEGKKIWGKNFGDAHELYEDGARSVQQTNDDGFIIAGFTTSATTGSKNVYLIKTDSNGKKVWQKTFGGNATDEYANSVQQTKDGGYIIAGSIDISVHADVYLIKTDSEGN